jgi:ATP-dependent Clp protease ATP-binding subunit ClpA
VDLTAFLRDAATPSLLEAVETALETADREGVPLRLAHVVGALLNDPSVRSRLGAEAADRLSAGLPHDSLDSAQFDLDGLIGPALALAKDWEAARVSPLTLLAACLGGGPMGDPDSVRTQEAVRHAGLTVEALMPQRSPDAVRRADFTCKALGYGTDLTEMARSGFWPQCPLVGQDRELKRLVMSMASGTDSVVVVGEPGVGKSAIVHGLAWHLANATRPLIPPDLDGHSIVALSPVNVLAGTGGRGQLEERLDAMLTFFRKHPHVIPFFDEIHSLLDTDDTEARSVATALKPPMVNGLFRCIGATTDKEFARFIASDEAMNSRFTRILIPEPDEDTTVQIISGIASALLSAPARAMNVSLSPETVRMAARLTSRYQRTERQPRKTIRLLRHVAEEVTYALQTRVPNTRADVSPEQVARTFSDTFGIPVDELDENRAGFYERLNGRLASRVKGQRPAIEAVTSWLALHTRGWVDPRRPRGRFLFLGPPGVGKTELASALAAELMKDRGSVVVKNMAEFKGEGARTRFMGADPGYVGYGQTPTLYSQVMMRPYSVVVLDEFEKAHPSLADPLLSILDGRAEDGQGRSVDFAQCIFVLTSNAIQAPTGPRPDEQTLRELIVAMGGIWTPPLADRIDRIALFQPLDESVLAEILNGMIDLRRARAAHPLPAEIDQPEERRQILEWAMEGEATPSARRLERAMLRWLTMMADRIPSAVE